MNIAPHEPQYTAPAKSLLHQAVLKHDQHVCTTWLRFRPINWAFTLHSLLLCAGRGACTYVSTHNLPHVTPFRLCSIHTATANTQTRVAQRTTNFSCAQTCRAFPAHTSNNSLTRHYACTIYKVSLDFQALFLPRRVMGVKGHATICTSEGEGLEIEATIS